VATRTDTRTEGPRHRRRRGPRADRGRHRFVYAPSAKARWMIPAGLALVILVVVATVLLVTDVTTS
jgi:hypothetical protein